MKNNQPAGKQVKLPQPTKRGEVLVRSTENLSNKEILDLLRILNQSQYYNNAVPSRTSKWLGKNYKALSDAQMLVDFETKKIDEDFAEYRGWVEKYTNGKFMYWDGVEDVIDEDPAKSTYGVKAYLDKDEKGMSVLINIANGKQITGAVTSAMFPYIADLEKRKLYADAKSKFDEQLKAHDEKKWEVSLIKIKSEYLDQTKFAVPTTMSTENGPLPLNQGTFNEYLVFDETDELPELEKN